MDDHSARRNSLTPAERSLRGRIGAYRLHALHDPKRTTAKARATFLARFLDEQPADLPEPERIRRAEAARRAHMAALAYRSARARRREPKVKTAAPANANPGAAEPAVIVADRPKSRARSHRRGPDPAA